MDEKTEELMTVTCAIADGGLPFLVFCSDITIPITNKTFANSYINYYNNDLKFKLGNLSCATLQLKWYNEDEEILEVYFKKSFMGLVLASELYSALNPCLNRLNELAHEYKTRFESE